MENTLTRLKKQNNEISSDYKELLEDFNKKMQNLNEVVLLMLFRTPRI